MKTIKFPIVFISIFVMTGIVAARNILFPVKILPAGILVVLIFLFIFHHVLNKNIYNSIPFTLLVATLSFLVGMLLYISADWSIRSGHYTHFINRESKNFISLKIDKILKPTKYYHRYLCEVNQINENRVQGKILLKISNKDALQNIGNQINILLDSMQIKPIPKALNPYAFNYRNYLANKQIYHQITLRDIAYESVFHKSGILLQYAEISRNKIKTLFKENGIKSDEYNLAVALFLGERQYLSDEIKQSFQNSGAIHILAISGLHIGILLIFLRFLFHPIKKFFGKTTFLFLTILFLWFYAFLTGFSPSVLRAVMMFSFLQIGLELRRATNVYNTLFAAALLLLVFQPNMVFEIGFQMSFAAVLSIVSFYPIFSKLYHIKHNALKRTIDLFVVSLAAQIGVLPFTLYYFHQFPIYFFLTNLFAIPLLFVVLLFGFALIFSGLSGIVIPSGFSIFSFLLKSLIFVNQEIASLKFSIINHIRFSDLLFVMVTIGIFVLYTFLKNKNNIKYIFLMLSWILLFQLTILFEKYRQSHTHKFYILHQYKTEVLALQQSRQLIFYQDSAKISRYILNDFKKSLGNVQTHFERAGFLYDFNNKKILVIDSLGIYNYGNLYPDFVLMSYSPKINFERMLLTLKPKKIIADGSNYPSFVKRWRKTAKKYGIPFHYTFESGALELEK